MAVNVAAISSISSSVTALSNLILVSPQNTVGYQPLNPVQANGLPSLAPTPAAFVFHYEGEQTVDLESDITDHYVEDNTAVQDQIALKPEIVNTDGFIGELNDVPPAFLAPVQAAAQKLTTVVAYKPQLTTTALIAYSEALFLYQTAANAVNSALSTVSSIGNAITGNGGQAVIGANGLAQGSAQNRQQTAFQQFYVYWKNRTLFNVQTPWAVFQNMAILKLKAIQDAETNVISDFHVTFKMIRVASTLTLSSSTSFLDGRLQSQGSSLVNTGTASPAPGPSLSSQVA